MPPLAYPISIEEDHSLLEEERPTSSLLGPKTQCSIASFSVRSMDRLERNVVLEKIDQDSSTRVDYGAARCRLDSLSGYDNTDDRDEAFGNSILAANNENNNQGREAAQLACTPTTTSATECRLDVPSLQIPVRASLGRTLSKDLNAKKVSFSSITVHYHMIGLGDSPSVADGPPIGLTWELLGSELYSNLDHYESVRPKLRGKKKMRLEAPRREKILLRQGTSMEDIQVTITLIEFSKEQHYQNCFDDDSTGENYSRTQDGCCALSSSYRRQEDLSSLLWFDWVCR